MCSDLTYVSRGQEEPAQTPSLPSYDSSCYLCPGNKRAQGDYNPTYKNTFVFVNDYSAVQEEMEEEKKQKANSGSSERRDDDDDDDEHVNVCLNFLPLFLFFLFQ